MVQTSPERTLTLPGGGVLLVGDYGSGKTEVAVNLALHLAARASDAQAPGEGPKLAIADLDLVNPYFRSREAREPLERAGVRVVVPPGDQQFADLPILLPEVKGLLQAPDTLAILDVGGDEAGSRVLSALGRALDPERHGFWFVVNANRPFCDTAEGVIATIRGIEGAAAARVSGLVANTHLMGETTAQMVLDGVALAEAVAGELGVPLELVAAMGETIDALPRGALGQHPLLRMERLMVPPWLRRPGAGGGGAGKGPALFKL